MYNSFIFHVRHPTNDVVHTLCVLHIATATHINTYNTQPTVRQSNNQSVVCTYFRQFHTCICLRIKGPIRAWFNHVQRCMDNGRRHLLSAKIQFQLQWNNHCLNQFVCLFRIHSFHVSMFAFLLKFNEKQQCGIVHATARIVMCH